MLTSGALCFSVQSACEQQSPQTWFVLCGHCCVQGSYSIHCKLGRDDDALLYLNSFAWHIHGSLQKTENNLRSQTGHSHMFTSCVKNVNPSTTRVYPNQRFHESPRQTQTHVVVATPQLLSSLQCRKKGTCSTPTPKCTSELLLFSPDATVTRNRSTRTKDGTQPRNTRQQSPKNQRGGNCFTCPR